MVVRDVLLLDGRRADIAVAADTIVGVGVVGDGRVEVVGGGLCTRPFTDPHLHLDKAGTADLLPGGAADLAEAITTMRTVKLQDRGAVERVAQRMARMLEVVRAGGTEAVRVVVDVDETWGLTSFHAAIGVRRAVAGSCDVRIVAFPQDGLSPEVEALLEQAADEGADVIGAHTDIDDDPADHLRRIGAIARRCGLPIEVHCDEGASPDRFFLPIVLEELAGDPVTLVHCLSLGTLERADRDGWLAVLAERGWPVCVAPSVLTLGVPLAPVRELIEAGVPVLVGSDNLQDVFCPLGTGRALDNARMAAVAGQLVRDELHAPLVAGITDVAHGVVTGGPTTIEVGSPADFVVHRAADATALLRGVDGIRLAVRAGSIEEQEEPCEPIAS